MHAATSPSVHLNEIFAKPAVPEGSRATFENRGALSHRVGIRGGFRMRKTAITLATVAALGATAIAAPTKPKRAAGAGVRASVSASPRALSAPASRPPPGPVTPMARATLRPRLRLLRTALLSAGLRRQPITADRASTATATGATGTTGKPRDRIGPGRFAPGHFVVRAIGQSDVRASLWGDAEDSPMNRNPRSSRMDRTARSRAITCVCWLAAISAGGIGAATGEELFVSTPLDAGRRIHHPYRGPGRQRRRRPVRGQHQDDAGRRR